MYERYDTRSIRGTWYTFCLGGPDLHGWRSRREARNPGAFCTSVATEHAIEDAGVNWYAIRHQDPWRIDHRWYKLLFGWWLMDLHCITWTWGSIPVSTFAVNTWSSRFAEYVIAADFIQLRCILQIAAWMGSRYIRRVCPFLDTDLASELKQRRSMNLLWIPRAKRAWWSALTLLLLLMWVRGGRNLDSCKSPNVLERQKLYSLRSIILFANTDISITKMCLNTTRLAKSIMGRREYDLATAVNTNSTVKVGLLNLENIREPCS
jgi:hypothetical protein